MLRKAKFCQGWYGLKLCGAPTFSSNCSRGIAQPIIREKDLETLENYAGNVTGS